MFSNILIIIFVCCFSFIIFECYEFIQNYNYIISFNEKYEKFEFTASPSYTYIDRSLFDPNDRDTDLKMKWRCASYNSKWYAVSDVGLFLKNNDYGVWDTETDCISNLFSSYFVNYNNPCSVSTESTYCSIFNSLRPT